MYSRKVAIRHSEIGGLRAAMISQSKRFEILFLRSTKEVHQKTARLTTPTRRMSVRVRFHRRDNGASGIDCRTLSRNVADLTFTATHAAISVARRTRLPPTNADSIYISRARSRMWLIELRGRSYWQLAPRAAQRKLTSASIPSRR
jgi:hypothetical protein